MKQELFYQPIYSRLKRIGVKTDPIAEKLGISRTAMRNWFDDGRLDKSRAIELAVALEEYSMEVRGVATELRKGFQKRSKK